MDASTATAGSRALSWSATPVSPATAKVYSPPHTAANTPAIGSDSLNDYFSNDAAASEAERARVAARIARTRKVSGLSLAARARAALSNRDNQRFAACLWSCGCAGWSDAALGALIPYMETYFGIGYTTVSTLFIGSCVGFGIATLLTTYLTDRLGKGKVITLGAAIQVAGYAVILAPPPFPVIPCAFILVGLGVALQLAQTNTYVALMPNSAQALGYLHGGYGLGGATSPLIATLFVSSGIRFSYFFSVSLAVAALNVLILLLSFRLERDAEPSNATQHALDDPSVPLATVQSRQTPASTRPPSMAGVPDEAIVAQAVPAAQAAEIEHRGKALLRNKTVWVVNGFLLLYCGAEVSIGGWIVSFLIEERAGSPSVGYVATGFWSGITLGRIILPRLNLLIGEKNVVFVYLAVVLALEMVIWFANQLIAASVAVALVGFALGPLYPNAISIASKLLPRRLHTGAIGIFASVGALGSALFPFLTGLLATTHGTFVLQPMVSALVIGMAGVWIFLPKVARRAE